MSQLQAEDEACTYNRCFVNILGTFNVLTVENTILLGGSSDSLPQDL